MAFLRFSCCWKDVRLKRTLSIGWRSVLQFQLLLKGCTIEAQTHLCFLRGIVSVVVERMYDWSLLLRPLSPRPHSVSVVIERMYDWSSKVAAPRFISMFQLLLKGCTIEAIKPLASTSEALRFQLLLKGCTIEAWCSNGWRQFSIVSVVVERMYDWSVRREQVFIFILGFSCCWKDVRLKHSRISGEASEQLCFSCCWKDVRLKLATYLKRVCGLTFQLLLKGCTIEATRWIGLSCRAWSFSCCWKDVRLKPQLQQVENCARWVSVVVERMYDWSCGWKETDRKEITFQLLLKGCTIEALILSAKNRRGLGFQLLLKGCTIEAPKPTDWKQMIFDSWFLICFSKMVDLHKKCHYFRKFGVIWVIAWLFLIVVVTSSYILSTTKSP